MMTTLCRSDIGFGVFDIHFGYDAIDYTTDDINYTTDDIHFMVAYKEQKSLQDRNCAVVVGVVSTGSRLPSSFAASYPRSFSFLFGFFIII